MQNFSGAMARGRAEAYPLWYVEDLNDARKLQGENHVSARQGWAGEKSDFSAPC